MPLPLLLLLLLLVLVVALLPPLLLPLPLLCHLRTDTLHFVDEVEHSRQHHPPLFLRLAAAAAIKPAHDLRPLPLVGERRQSRPRPRPPHLSVPLVQLLPRSRRSVTAKEPVWRVLSVLPAWTLVVMVGPPVVARDCCGCSIARSCLNPLFIVQMVMSFIYIFKNHRHRRTRLLRGYIHICILHLHLPFFPEMPFPTRFPPPPCSGARLLTRCSC
jgi:hypothetical protein